MAFITAETRSDLIELSVAMLKQAPSAALLEELIALSVGGGSLADAADHIAKTAAFKAEYPSFQTAEQYATEIFDNITTGGTVTAAIRTAVIELATGMLTSGSVTKAGLALAIAEYLAAPAALLNTDFADIAQSFQNRADAAEYFVVTKELGGSTAAELAAAIASVTSDAATLTAANTAADATASAEAVVAGQTFTLTTGLDTLTGSSADDVFTAAPGTSAVTGNPTTTITSGDKIVGSAGNDILNITATASNNNSLTGLTVSGVEVINVTDANNIGGNSGDIATALTAQTAAEAALVSKSAIDAVAVAEDNAATALDDLIVDVLASAAEADSVEDALGWVSLATPAAVVSAKAALDYLEENSFTDYAEIAGVLASGYTLPTGVTAFTLAEMKAAATATLTNADSSSNVNSDAGITARLDDLIDEVNVTVNYTQGAGSTEVAQDAQSAAYTALSESVEEADVAVVNAGMDVMTLAAATTSVAQAAQIEDAYEAVLALATDNAAGVTAVEGAVAATTSPSDSFTVAQYNAAAAAVEKTQAGVAHAVIAAVSATTELQTVTFTAMEPGQSINVNGLRLFTTIALDATEVADLFAGVEAADTAGVTLNGVTYSGAFAAGLDAEAAATGATIGLDGEATGPVAAITITSVGATAPTVVETTPGLDAVTGVSVAEAQAVRAAELDAAATDVNAEIGGGLAAATFSVANVEAAVVASAKNAVTGVALTTPAAIEAAADVLATAYAAYADAIESAGVDTYTFADLKTAAAAAQVSLAGASLVTDVNDSATIEDRAEAIMAATGTALTTAETALATAAGTDITASTAYSIATAAATNGSVAASIFSGSEEIWLKGASNKTNVTGITTQTIGLDGLSGVSSSLGFGAATGSIYSKGASGALTVTGAKALSLSGTTGTLALTAASSTSLAVNMSGANALTLTGADALTSIAVSGAGKSTLTGVSATVESITSAAGAVSATISTVTVVDNAATDAIETVDAVVATGAGADTITVSTTGTGKTTISTGAGDDTIVIGARGLNTRDSIDAGTGTDYMVLAGKTYTAQDYVVLDSAVTGVEVALFYSSVTADAVKLAIPVLALESGGTITEASTTSITTWGDLTVSSTGYVVAAGVVETVYGGNLAVTLTGGTSVLTTKKTGTGGDLVLNADSATVAIAATSNGSISTTTIAGDVKTLTVNMSNSKTTTADALASTTITVTATENEALTSVDLNGTGSVVINTSAAADQAIVLATIDASGLGGTTLYTNGLASSTVGSITGGLTFTGNIHIAETISLGLGTDSVTVNSDYEHMDTISGADFVKETSTAKSTTDVIVFGGLTLDGSAADEIAELELTANATSLSLAFTEAAASGSTTIYFAYDGDTYLFKDGGNSTLDDSDLAVKIVGLVSLDEAWGVYSA